MRHAPHHGKPHPLHVPDDGYAHRRAATSLRGHVRAARACRARAPPAMAADRDARGPGDQAADGAVGPAVLGRRRNAHEQGARPLAVDRVATAAGPHAHAHERGATVLGQVGRQGHRPGFSPVVRLSARDEGREDRDFGARDVRAGRARRVPAGSPRGRRTSSDGPSRSSVRVRTPFPSTITRSPGRARESTRAIASPRSGTTSTAAAPAERAPSTSPGGSSSGGSSFEMRSVVSTTSSAPSPASRPIACRCPG